MKITSTAALVFVLVVAVLLVVAAAFYVGGELARRPDEARVVALIEERLSKHRADAPPPEPRAPPERQGERKLSDAEFNARVERSIIAYIDKQRKTEQERPNLLAKNVPPPSADDHVYGHPDAPIALIEYSDFECPYCKRFHLTAKQLVDRSNNQVKWIYRHFPLEFHNPGAQKQAEASECAAALGGATAFWKYADAIYARTTANGKGFPIANLVPLAVELGIDRARFTECLESGRMNERVQRDIASGKKAGINGTPGTILLSLGAGEVIALVGAQPYERMNDAVRKLLKSRP